jgi:glyoxylase-like metal-dependent hydrolase (beta-lactamase superfamily II)
MRTLSIVAALVVVISPAGRAFQPVEAPEVTEIGKGVYAFVHPSASLMFPNSNTTVVVGDTSVLVVDSTYLEEVAAADIAAIRKITNKPVRYLVNTHWHYDHNNGNIAYRKASPDIEVVAQIQTKRLMDAQSPSLAAFASSATSPLQGILADRKKQLGSADLPEDQRTTAERDVAWTEREINMYKNYQYVSPTLTFDRELRIDLGGREVRVLHFGRGNTPGDAVLFVPDAEVVATGDLVVAPVPYAYNSYPAEWIETLEHVRSLHAKVLVPGHGPVMHDDSYLVKVQGVLRFATEQALLYARTHAQSTTNDNLDDVRKAIDFSAWRAAFVGDVPARNATFDSSIVGALVERVIAWARGQQ